MTHNWRVRDMDLLSLRRRLCKGRYNCCLQQFNRWIQKRGSQILLKGASDRKRCNSHKVKHRKILIMYQNIAFHQCHGQIPQQVVPGGYGI